MYIILKGKVNAVLQMFRKIENEQQAIITEAVLLSLFENGYSFWSQISPTYTQITIDFRYRAKAWHNRPRPQQIKVFVEREHEYQRRYIDERCDIKCEWVVNIYCMGGTNKRDLNELKVRLQDAVNKTGRKVNFFDDIDECEYMDSDPWWPIKRLDRSDPTKLAIHAGIYGSINRNSRSKDSSFRSVLPYDRGTRSTGEFIGANGERWLRNRLMHYDMLPDDYDSTEQPENPS